MNYLSNIISLLAIVVSVTALTRARKATEGVEKKELMDKRNLSRQVTTAMLARIDYLLIRRAMMRDAVSSHKNANSIPQNKADEIDALLTKLDQRIESLERMRGKTTEILDTLDDDNEMAGKDINYFINVLGEYDTCKTYLEGNAFDAELIEDQRCIDNL
ncbi:MAG: hypothetical protein OEV42_14055 [Deltaproteobacteria bacterium]|nr:hypothetical protein [Deltaproteobacteria bacterium]